MAARYELEVTISSAKNLKNINWRHGPLKPYAVVWVDPKNKCSTPVDEEGDESPIWNHKLVIPLNNSINESTLYIDIVHAKAASEDTKPLIGSAKLKLNDVVKEVGIGEIFADDLKLKRPSGRPHGKVEVQVSVREPRYRAPDPYYPAPGHYPAPAQAYGESYPTAAPTAAQYGGNYPYDAPPSGYPYSGSGGPPATSQYGQSYGGYGSQPAYGGGQTAYGGGQPSSYGGYTEEKKSKYGMGTGLAVGAAAGLLGGLAIGEGIDYVENEIAEDAAEKVEEDLGYDDDDE